MWFWIPAGALALAVVLTILWALLRRRAATADAVSDVQIYRDQLAAVERDVERGTIGANDAERIRIEVSRRLLAADKAQANARPSGTAPRWLSYTAAAVAAVGVIGGAIWMYLDLGAPGYPDLGLQKRLAMADKARAERPSQAEVEARQPERPSSAKPSAKYMALLEKLRAAVKARPNDLRGQILLVRNEAGIGHFRAAARAQGKVIALKKEKASAEDFAEYGNLLILSADGYVSPQAEAALEQALRRDPKNGTALYFSGLMFAQTGRPDIAFRIWRDLLDASPADAPWIKPIRAQIMEAARLAGVRYSLPPAPAASRPGLKGPSADDVAAAGQMSGTDRQAFIKSMVARLSERLDTKGGSAAEWARLIGAYGVLGQKAKAQAAWEKATAAFAGKDADLATIRTAAQHAGLTN